MTRKDINFIRDSLTVLIGQPLTNLGRARAMIVANFGELVETNIIKRGEDGIAIRNEKGRLVYTRGMEGKYVLSAMCSMRFTCDDEILLASSDILLPNRKIAHSMDFDWHTFNWGHEGNNYYDEVIGRHFSGKFSEYIVKSIEVKKHGDLTILFENGFQLELCASYSRDGENWSVYELNSDNALTILGNGIEKR